MTDASSARKGHCWRALCDPDAKVSVTGPDSRSLKTKPRWLRVGQTKRKIKIELDFPDTDDRYVDTAHSIMDVAQGDV